MKRRLSRDQSSVLILSIDIGTSSLRTALFDARSRRLVRTTAQEAYSLRVTADGGAELSPQTLRQTFLRCLAKTLRVYRTDRTLRLRPIIAVGTSCFWHSLLGVDESGRALTPIYTWADSRSREDAARLRGEFSERAVHARTGCMLRSSFWPAKLLWLRRTQPKLFASVTHWMSPAEWLQREFCGDACCSYAMASATGLFNPATLRWDAGLLKRCRISPRKLNALSEEPLQSSARLGRRFPELREALWFPAIGDGAASNLGSGATKPGLAALNVGTSAAIRLVSRVQRARAPFGLFCYRVDAKRLLIGGAVSNAGNLRTWCVRQLNLPHDPKELERALAARLTPLHGLTVLPFWVSERAPTWPEELHGAIVGLKNSSSALDILQATREAVFQRLAQIAELLPIRKFVVSGGIQKSPADMQRLADVLGRSLIVCSEPEASLRGAAVFAFEKLGVTVPSPSAGRVIHPRLQFTRQYMMARRRQQRLEKLLGSSRLL
ncbi:MAG TPA: gluconokinase [Verrucomicrobiae bacterium]|nr:gluconokinase [Verrucomicrobiae bacterium]